MLARMFDTVDLLERCRKLADRDAALLDDDDLLADVAAVEQARSLLDITEAHDLAELDRRGVCDERFGHTTKTWLAGTADISARTAGSRVKTARRLSHLPALDAAVSSGEVSFEHLATLAADANPRVLKRLADVDDDVTALACELPFDRWRGEVRRLVELLDDDGAEPEETTNRLRFGESLDGVTHLDGTMTADLAAIVRDAVEARADELYKQQARDHELSDELPIPPRKTLRMLALADLIRGKTTRRAEVTLLLRGHQLTDEGGRSMPEATAGVWGCDPDLWAVLVDEMGLPLDVGHAKRFATVAQRRAIHLRDGGCGFPGCDQPMRRCDVHHLRSPLLGGRTAVDAMVALCRRHHGVTHRRGGGWSPTATEPLRGPRRPARRSRTEAAERWQPSGRRQGPPGDRRCVEMFLRARGGGLEPPIDGPEPPVLPITPPPKGCTIVVSRPRRGETQPLRPSPHGA
jgi:Domain of unknown function (DUF222)